MGGKWGQGLLTGGGNKILFSFSSNIWQIEYGMYEQGSFIEYRA